MHALKRTWDRLSVRTLVSLSCECHDALVGDVATLDQSNTLELGECRELFNRLIRQVLTAGKVNVANASAHADQLLNASIRNARTVAKMDVVEILAKLRDRRNGTVGDLTAFGKDKVTQTWGSCDDLLDADIVELPAVGQVEYAQALVRRVLWEIEEGMVRDTRAVRQAEFSEMAALPDQGRDRSVFQVSTVLQVNFKNVAAVVGKSHDGVVRDLTAVVEFELFTGSVDYALSVQRKPYSLDVPAAARNRLQRIIVDLSAAADIQALELEAVLGKRVHGPICEVLQFRDVQRQEAAVAVQHTLKAKIGQLDTLCQGQALDPLATREGLQGAVADFDAERGKIESLDQSLVVEVAVDLPDGLDDGVHTRPLVGLRAVPQQAYAVPSPVFGNEHA